MKKFHHADVERIKYLKRLSWAVQSMQLALEGCKMAMAMEDNVSEARALVSGAVSTTYCSPFTEANELGKLDDRYSRFEKTEFADTHASLWDYRNKFFAHRDIGNALVNVRGTVLPVHEVGIEIRPNGSLRIATSLMIFRNTQFERIVPLCEFQLKRFNEKSQKLITQLSKHGAEQRTGNYVLGVSYP